MAYNVDHIPYVRTIRSQQFNRGIDPSHDGLRIVDVHADQCSGHGAPPCRIHQHEVQLPTTGIVDRKRQMARVITGVFIDQLRLR